VFQQLVDAMAGNAWGYVLLALVVAGDALLPLLPGETMVVTGGVLASAGALNLPLVILVGALAAFAGDNASYWLGRRFGTRAAGRFLRGERGKRSLEWAERTLDTRGRTLIAVARFVPGGRTAVTFGAGTTSYPYRRFAVADGVGVAVWAAYNALLGQLGGETFENEPWKGLLLAFGLAFATLALIEGVRFLLGRRNRRTPEAHS
jgi:membrane-associated protein